MQFAHTVIFYRCCRGGEIWAQEVDALGAHMELAAEKFCEDIRYAWRPSTTSRVAVHLRDTQLNAAFIEAIAQGMKRGGGNIQRVAFILSELQKFHF